MQNNNFFCTPFEVVCSDLKIVFIIDEKTKIADNTDIHLHSFWELFFLENGSLTVSDENVEQVISKNQIMLIAPGTYHRTLPSHDAVKKSIFFTFCKVKSSDSEKLYDQMQSAFSNFSTLKLNDCGYIGMMLSVILRNLSENKFATSWRIKSIVANLMFSLYDRIDSENNVQTKSVDTQNKYWGYKYAIERLMDIYYTDDISLDFLSSELYLSPQNLTKIISATYGKSFNELKQELKMRNAKRLLSETSLSITEISKKIGYSSSRGFLTAFLKYAKCTPSEYRREKQGN